MTNLDWVGDLFERKHEKEDDRWQPSFSDRDVLTHQLIRGYTQGGYLLAESGYLRVSITILTCRVVSWRACVVGLGLSSKIPT